MSTNDQSPLPPRKRPLVLGCFGFLLSMQAFLMPLMILVMFLTPSHAFIDYQGEQVRVGSVRLTIIGWLVIWFLFAAYTGPGLWKGKPTARHVAFGTYASGGLCAIFLDPSQQIIVPAIFGCLAVGGYLYAKPNVRAFFDDFSVDV